jgi:hypothetical protein
MKPTLKKDNITYKVEVLSRNLDQNKKPHPPSHMEKEGGAKV